MPSCWPSISPYELIEFSRLELPTLLASALLNGPNPEEVVVVGLSSTLISIGKGGPSRPRASLWLAVSLQVRRSDAALAAP
ncbi:hypothetical protein KC322_g79 [Hortaea werneckii]|nr:hypothetical protein KC322_g79 [Hortaea werneckii]